MDWTSIIVASIAFLGTFGGSLAGIRASNRVMEYRLKQLEEKVDKHNSLIQRTFELEETTGRLDERVKNLEGRRGGQAHGATI